MAQRALIFAPTPQDVVEQMLDIAHVANNDTVLDLGSRDVIVIAAVKKFGARAIGYEIDPELVDSSRELIEHAGVQRLAENRQQDMYTADLSEARVVAVFLYPAALQELKPYFDGMKKACWIVIMLRVQP